MPSGKTHLKVSLVSSALIVPLLFSTAGAQSVSEAVAITAGCAAGCVLTPDLDVDAGNYSYYLARRFAGSVGNFFFSLFWQPYALAIRHRSVLSHGILVGTIIRLIYLLFPVLIFIVNESKHSSFTIFLRSLPAQLLVIPLVISVFLLAYYGTINVPIVVLFFLPWFALDTLHSLADFIF